MVSKYLSIIIAVLLLLGISIPDSAIAEKLDTDNLSRMFLNPTGRIPPSGVVNIAFSGAFASQGGREFNGLATAALGGFLEFGFNSSNIMTNIRDDATPMSMIILKFSVFQPKSASRLPYAMVALSSNNWTGVKTSGGDKAGPALNDELLARVEFDAHLSSLYLSLTSLLSSTYSIHAGVILHDLRTRNLHYFGSTGEPDDVKETVIGVLGGVEHRMNKTTRSVFEFGSKPKIRFSEDMSTLSVQRVWQAMAGMRFFFTKYAALDVGVRYRDDYSGLADAEILLGINVGVDVLREVSSRKHSERKNK